MSDDAKLEILLTAKDMTARTFSAFQARIGTITRSVTSLKGVMAALGVGFGLKEIGGAALNVADSFEQMEIKLNALTDGRGTQTLAELNDWAREMPVNTRKAVDTFVMMQALGLDPTIDKMQTLVDVSSIFGEDTMPRVARALGQMQTLGKLSAEELNQLSEAGINARKYLTEAFGMTVEELQKSQVSIDRIIQAIWDGLNADYAGGAQAAMKSWRGLTTVFKSNMTEITRQVMDAGVFDEVKSQLDDINKKMGDWIENNNTLLVSFSENIGAIVEGLGKIAKYAGLRSITGTMQQAGELSKQGLLDLTDFMRLSFVERQKLVDDILAKQRQILASPLQIAAQSSTANATKQQGPRYNPWEAYLPEWTVPPSIVDNFNKPFLDLLPTTDDIETALDDFVGGIDAARNKIHEADTAAWEDFKISLDAWEDSNRERLEEVLNQQDEFDRQMIQLTRHTADAMQQNFSDLFFDALTGELRTFQDYATAIFKSIARAWADMAGQMAAQGLFGQNFAGGGLLSDLGSWFGATFNGWSHPTQGIAMHTGGVVGVDGGSPRSVPAGAFIGAPRLHGGFMPGEYPAILQRNETVLTPAQMAAVSGAGRQPVINRIQVINESGGRVEASMEQPRFDGAEWVSRMWIRAANDDVNGLGAFVRGRR